MAQENPYAKYREQSQPVPVSQIKPIIAAPVDPNKQAQEARAETGTQINVAEEARAGRKEKFDYAKNLRDEFRKAPETTNYETVIRQFSSALGAQPTPTGDQALITAYAKMLDPASVVREAEFATVQAGDSKLGSIVARLNKELGTDESGLIRPEVRARVLQEMRNLTDNYRAGYDRARSDYEGLAGSYGIDPKLVLGTRIDEPYQPKIEKLWQEKGIGEAQGEQLGLEAGATFSTDKDKAIAAAVQQAWASGADVQGLAAAAESAGGVVTPSDIEAFQQAVEARAKRQPVTFTPAQSGQRSPLQQAAGEFLMTPVGTALTGAVNAAGFGALSQVAGDQIQGLEALNPAAGMTGEVIGSALGTAGLAKGAAAGLKAVAPGMAERLAGGGLAGAVGREALTDATYGGLYAANTGEDIGTGVALGALGSLGGQAVAAGARRVAPAVGRMLGREVPPPDGGVPPMGGPGVPPMGGGVPPAGGAMGGAADAGVPPMGGGAAMGGAEEPFIPSTTTFRGGGAEGTSLETLRRTQAEGLPVPVELTLGAATRDAEQLAFEKEQLYGALGGPLRKRAEENNLQALENFDRFIDETGATKTENIADSGNAVIKALSEGYKAAKNKVNVAYKRAEQSEGAQEPVSYAELKAYIDGQDEATKDLAPVLKSVAQQIAKNDPQGTGQISVATMENIRKLISRNSQQGTPSSVYGGEMKGIIDTLTEGKGGELYNKARKLRIEQARKFENRAIVARLVSNVKNMDDPKVAADEVFKKSIMNEAPEDIKFLRQTLRTLGPDGRQAWSELQGATVRDIAKKATANSRLTADNQAVISADGLNKAIKALDENGRLDVIFNPKMARQLRDLRDVVMYVNTVPPGTSINSSGTARTLAALFGEMAITGGASAYLTGSTVPVPIVTGIKMMMKASKDREIRQKIARSLLPPETP